MSSDTAKNGPTNLEPVDTCILAMQSVAWQHGFTPFKIEIGCRERWARYRRIQTWKQWLKLVSLNIRPNAEIEMEYKRP